MAMGGGIFALRRPRPYSRHCGEIVGGITTLDPIYAPQTTTGTAWRRITTRHAASLRPSKNGRIGFKPPYSKGESSQKPRMGSIFYGEGFSPLAMKKISIKQLQLFEDRSDAACRVVVKTGVSMCGMARAWWRPWAAFGRDADRNEIPANARL